ncbi:aspartyl-phosphate phosphatase Spo0E family protein [Tuberibacillus sp. Marseille-P3662]|uniref:aspartyl-phosphate phosphatase Spo0E family protein n=1 Tax=Tuberibacillus sp. Marseille-P3662 TaxID=1965358 RepID=UPI0020CB4A5D|nr:aspartyl-phosphate phosphatase Spo0E family protein [Tuberibacillus sp. Marseille-P3662]
MKLKGEIEQARQALIEEARHRSLTEADIISSSTQLDRLIVDYHKLRTDVPSTKTRHK